MKNGTLNVSGGTFSGNDAGGNSKAYGGAIYVSDGCSLSLSGGEFDGNTAKSDGACIYLTSGSTLNLSGASTFGSDADANTVARAAYASASNGQQGVYANGRARQDIFIAEASGDSPSSIAVTGDLTGAEGSIWAWANSEDHYRRLAKTDLVGFCILDWQLALWMVHHPGNQPCHTRLLLLGCDGQRNYRRPRRARWNA